MQQALQEVNRAYVLSPVSRKITIEFSKLLHVNDRQKQALNVLKKYLEAKPRDVRVLRELAQRYEQTTATKETQSTYALLFRLVPDDFKIGIKFSKAQMRAGDVSGSVATVDDLIQRFPD